MLTNTNTTQDLMLYWLLLIHFLSLISIKLMRRQPNSFVEDAFPAGQSHQTILRLHRSLGLNSRTILTGPAMGVFLPRKKSSTNFVEQTNSARKFPSSIRGSKTSLGARFRCARLGWQRIQTRFLASLDGSCGMR